MKLFTKLLGLILVSFMLIASTDSVFAASKNSKDSSNKSSNTSSSNQGSKWSCNGTYKVIHDIGHGRQVVEVKDSCGRIIEAHEIGRGNVMVY